MLTNAYLRKIDHLWMGFKRKMLVMFTFTLKRQAFLQFIAHVVLSVYCAYQLKLVNVR